MKEMAETQIKQFSNGEITEEQDKLNKARRSVTQYWELVRFTLMLLDEDEKTFRCLTGHNCDRCRRPALRASTELIKIRNLKEINGTYYLLTNII